MEMKIYAKEGQVICSKCGEYFVPDSWPTESDPFTATTCPNCHDTRWASFYQSKEFCNPVSILCFPEVQGAIAPLDRSYNTVRCGTVPSFSGTVEFEFATSKFKAIGHRPTGTAEYVRTSGYVEITLA